MPVTLRQHAVARRPFVHKALYPTANQRKGLVQEKL